MCIILRKCLLTYHHENSITPEHAPEFCFFSTISALHTTEWALPYISLNVGHIDYDITFCSQTVEISTLTIRKVKSGDTLDIDSKLIPEGYDCMLVYFSHKGDSIRVGFTLTAKNGKYVSSYPKATEVYLTGV